MHRIWSFLTSRLGNGALVVVYGIFLFLLGTANSTPALLLAFIVLAMSGIFAVRRPAAAALESPIAAQATVDIKATLDAFMIGLRGNVADDLYNEALAIRRSIIATIPTNGAAFDAVDPDIYLIRQTAMSYLPEAFATYRALPRAVAERQAVAGGQTPHDVLLAQLMLMDARLADVATAIATHDSDKILANGRFLREKFFSSSLRVDAPVAIGVPVPLPASVAEPALVEKINA